MTAKIRLLSTLISQDTPIGRVHEELEIGDRLVLKGVEYRVMGKFAQVPWGSDKFAEGTRWRVRVQSLEELSKEPNWKHRIAREEGLLRPLLVNAGINHRRLTT